MRVTILGCGGSSGVPLIGGVWGDCDPNQPRNCRRRPSILVQTETTTVLVDTTPDMRDQLTDAGIRHLDGVLYTHAHADHTHGIDDLRGLNWQMRTPVDVYGDAATLASLRHRFDYCFKGPSESGYYARPALEAHEITGPLRIGDLDIVPFVQDHGYSQSLGFRFGKLGYSTDCVALDDGAFAALDGVDTWIVDCVRMEPSHPVHAHWPITRGWIDRLNPRRAILTHMNHTMDYDTLCRTLPDGVEPGYDGMAIEL
ncbi:MBL fold metallo-hydrolase [Aerophototrophica crusticola]|uniref:MBL fold metallo-hydrolase n=1 Tax=Aerophototrophica crusticola TaxID=1709002 RepID=A0A858R670_9PROT|nr:MBL fold metallo-hydrolase [Rhodospirillaceae bacterium B3]